MAEPIKCPFCGRIPTVEDCGTNRWFVRCQCGIAQDKLYHQRCDAVRAWNRRKSVTDVPSAQSVVGTYMSSANDTIYRQAAIESADKIISRDDSGNNDVVKAMTAWKEFIKALPSAQPEHLVKESGNLVKGLVNDCISRQAAIDALCDNCDDVKSVCAHYPCKRYIAIEQLPSVQPQRWIPVTEALPKNGHYYLKCTKYGNVDVDYYWDGFENATKYGEEIVAWMEKPKPYKGGTG